MKYLPNSLILKEIAFINYLGNWWTKVAGKNCSTEFSGQMAEVVQFEVRSLLENNASYAKSLLTFFLGATYDTLPSTSNVHRWCIHLEPSCYICSKTVCIIAHVLGACNVAFQQGRFTYCHDLVLLFLTALNIFLSSYSVSESSQHNMNLVSSWLGNYVWFQQQVS